MKKTIAIIGTVSILLLASLFLSISSQAQIVNMGSTTLASQNVRYANEAGTGTTANKLAKLTGAPSTAIITAITDTSGIVGIVVKGAGTTGSADIAFAGKASCVFDSATTAGHYVTNDTSTAGDCMDAGATYPTSGQVIGIVTSTNGGAGTYEVDLTLGQPKAGGSPMPTRATMWHDASIVTAGNAIVITHDALQNYSLFSQQPNAADGDTFTQSFLLAAGTYTLAVLGQTNNSKGRIDWYIDNVKVVSLQDWYSAGVVYNVVQSVASITVTGSGRHVLKGVINGHNGSSSNYWMLLTKIWLVPASDTSEF